MIKKLLISLSFVILSSTFSYAAQESQNPKVMIKTSMGGIKIELFEKEAPLSVRNFLEYVESGFYSGTIFHRVIPGFMIQGGGFNTMIVRKNTRSPIKNEAGNGLKNSRGTLAMARTSVVDSATSQFFINVADNRFLDHKSETADGYGYAVFGRVIEGMDVVERIAAARTTRREMPDMPEENIVINSVFLLK